MKLIIDIPEDTYERVMNPDKFYRDIDGEKIRWAVYKGTPIHNVTNGDIVMAFFPNEHDFETDFDTVWWNSPYQKGGKG